jgi:ribosomal protein S18 acetylase RimI-like enzyme
MQSSAKIAIRSARPEDFPAILDIWERFRSAAASVPDDDAALATLAHRDPEALLVAEEGGRIVGTVIAAWDGWRGGMYRLSVVSERRRQGIALQLVREGQDRLRAKGARRISVLVAADDEAAASLWRAAGYAVDRNVERFVTNLKAARGHGAGR